MATPLVLLSMCIDISIMDIGFKPFTATIMPGSDWTVVVTPTSGNPDLFVNVGTAAYVSNTFGVDVVTIPAPATDTEISISVLGNSDLASYNIKVCAVVDADNDGVPNDKDLCPGSTRGSRDHVDVNGCEHDQVDFDMDGVCNAGMPRIDKKPFSTRADFCVGVDNCKFVKNAGQEQNYPADAGNDGDGAGDACNTG
jgi:hypothetical protein